MSTLDFPYFSEVHSFHGSIEVKRWNGSLERLLPRFQEKLLQKGGCSLPGRPAGVLRRDPALRNTHPFSRAPARFTVFFAVGVGAGKSQHTEWSRVPPEFQ